MTAPWWRIDSLCTVRNGPINPSAIFPDSLKDIRVSVEFVLDADSLLVAPQKITLQLSSPTRIGGGGLLLFVKWEMGDLINIYLYIHVTVHRNGFLFNEQPDALIIQIYSVIKLHVSGISSPHHQDISTVHSALVSFMQVFW